jgi:hypothetical protein
MKNQLKDKKDKKGGLTKEKPKADDICKNFFKSNLSQAHSKIKKPKKVQTNLKKVISAIFSFNNISCIFLIKSLI